MFVFSEFRLLAQNGESVNGREDPPVWSPWMKPELSLPSAFSRFLHLARRFWNQTCQHRHSLGISLQIQQRHHRLQQDIALKGRNSISNMAVATDNSRRAFSTLSRHAVATGLLAWKSGLWFLLWLHADNTCMTVKLSDSDYRRKAVSARRKEHSNTFGKLRTLSFKCRPAVAVMWD
jgi:hypothetical protein